MYCVYRDFVIAHSEIEDFVPIWSNATPLTRQAWAAAARAFLVKTGKAMEAQAASYQ